MIEHSSDPAARRALGLLIEAELFDANAYNGFAYLPSELLPDGTLKPDYDDTRRGYFHPRR